MILLHERQNTFLTSRTGPASSTSCLPALANDKGKHSRRKNLGKSWKQILVEHWTSHYFSLCLQMLLATMSSAKGQNKGACHRTTNPALLPFTASTFTFFLFLSFHFDAPPLPPTTLCHLLPIHSSIFTLLLQSLPDYFRFTHSPHCPFISSSLFFYAPVLITGSRTG